MCIHMLDMVRWMLGLGWPKMVSSAGGILVQKGSASNITDTQSATFDFGDLKAVWQHRTYGAPADPEYPWGRRSTATRDAQGERPEARVLSARGEAAGAQRHPAVRVRQVPRGQDGEGPRTARRVGAAAALAGLPDGPRNSR